MRPTISKSQHQVLKQLVENPLTFAGTKEIGQLTAEINRAEILPDDEIPSEVIGINSFFIIEEMNSKKKMELTLTLPDNSDLKQKKVSVLSPLGIALIGFKKGDIVDWLLPVGARKLKIIDVQNPQN